jgi:hypothetical protein
MEHSPTKSYCIPFTVVEEQKTEEAWRESEDPRVRRLIHWPEQLNEHIRRLGYKPQLEEMRHVSYFLQDLRYECTTTGDLAVSFYQIPLTERQKAFTRFYDMEGNLYQWTRGLMGHVCFPEIMTIATSVISGDPARCTPECSLLVSSRRVWIDNVKLSGAREQMRMAGDFLDRAAAAVGATVLVSFTARRIYGKFVLRQI